MEKFKSLENIFNVEATTIKSTNVEKAEDINSDKKESDFDLARETLRDLITKNNSVIDDIISIARSSETARPFEVVGQLLKTQSEMAKDLIGIHKQKKEIDGSQSDKIQQQNNIVFAGSTSDLMKMISASRANVIDVDTKK